MGFFSNKIERNAIEAGDHIYTYRAAFSYSHHGIYVGGNKVVHFTRDSTTSSFPTSYSSMCKTPSTTCTSYPEDCGFRQPESRVVLSCLDCFLQSGALYRFEYGVTTAVFCSRVRGGSCTTATSDGPTTAVHRAMYLLYNGFGNYDVFQNNCEDFALYCKTALLIVKKDGFGRSGQIAAAMGGPIAVVVSYPLKFFLPIPVVATVTAGSYCFSRYANDIGKRSDAVKVNVEHLDIMDKWRSKIYETQESQDI